MLLIVRLECYYPRVGRGWLELHCQRDGGCPNGLMGNPLAAMDGTGPMGNAIVLLLLFFFFFFFPRRPLPVYPGRIG